MAWRMAGIMIGAMASAIMCGRFLTDRLSASDTWGGEGLREVCVPLAAQLDRIRQDSTEVPRREVETFDLFL